VLEVDVVVDPVSLLLLHDEVWVCVGVVVVVHGVPCALPFGLVADVVIDVLHVLVLSAALGAAGTSSAPVTTAHARTVERRIRLTSPPPRSMAW
jgi:hypothetical protein